MLQRALTNAGYRVVTAIDGADASTMLSSIPVDAIVTDLIMPKKDGLQLLMELRKTYPSVRVVVMTGGGHISSEEYLKYARAFGAHAILPKPFTHDQLLDAMAKILPPKSTQT